MARLLTLPGDIQSFVAELARFEPTPSASAMRARLEECPRIGPMIDFLEPLPPSLIILRADELGLTDCRKCGNCTQAALHQIRLRCQHDPERGKPMFNLRPLYV